MKIGCRASVIAAALALAAVVPAGAATPPEGGGLEQIEATCNGQATTVTASGGVAFWANGQKYSITSFSGTFTPADGSDPQSFTKVNGKRSGKTEGEINCVGTESGPEGTFEFDVVGVLIR